MAFSNLFSALIVLSGAAIASSTTIELCAVPFTTRSNQHLLATVGRNQITTSRWIPLDNTQFKVTFSAGFSTVNLNGELREVNSPATDTMIMDYTFFENHGVDTCFCSSSDFLTPFDAGTETKPLYFKVQRDCKFDEAFNPVLNPTGLDYCPVCEEGQCGNARKAGGPMPIWTEWQFYSAAEGSVEGDGVPIFRDAIAKTFPVINENNLTCTPSLRNQPSAQIFCTNYTNPSLGTGYGVNGKNQRCGMAVWFNCEEDLAALDASTSNPAGFIRHEADINFNLVPCDRTCDGDIEEYLITDSADPTLTEECETLRNTLLLNDCIETF